MVLTYSQHIATKHLSKDTISDSVDKAMDRAMPSNGAVMPGISIRNGPMEEVDSPMPDANGVDKNGAGPVKRKGRESLTRPSYAESESSEDDKPLVGSFEVIHLTPTSMTDNFPEQTSENIYDKSQYSCRVRL